MESANTTTEIDFNNWNIQITDTNGMAFSSPLDTRDLDFAVDSSGNISGSCRVQTAFTPLSHPPAPEVQQSITAPPRAMKHIPLDDRGGDGLRKINIIIAGVGGTGGYVARDLARYVYSLNNKSKDIQVKIHLFDGDKVEEKNLVRQNFILPDQGKYKSDVIAKRYGAAFGVDIQSHPEMLNENKIRDCFESSRRCTNILVGCVDNNLARREFHSYLETSTNTYWLDSGNEKSSGQVVLGFGRILGAYHDTSREALHETNFRLPRVTDIYPEILDPTQDNVNDDGLSCAERALVEDQNIFVNMTAAVHTLNFLRQIIMQEPITVSSVEFNIKGVGKVNPLTPELIGGFNE